MSAVSISIVTPTLNAEEYVHDCVSSVRAQAWPALEHIVVDGGSRDRTVLIATKAGARIFQHPGTKQSAAINEGLRHASGEIAAWLNADDLYHPGALAYVGAQFANDASLDVLYGDCDVIGQRGELLWREHPGPYDFARLRDRGNYLAQPAVFLRARVFDRVGYLDESLDYAMDFDLWLRLRDLNVRYMPRVLAAFRWHRISKTATSNAANWRELLVISRRYGGGWTPHLAWSFVRARVSVGRHRVLRALKMDP